MHIFSTPYSQDVGKVYLSPEGRGPKFYNIHCTDSHDKDECYIVLKIAKMWNNHRNVTIALGGQRLTHSIRHIKSSHALTNAASSQAWRRDINSIVNTQYTGEGMESMQVAESKHPDNTYLKNPRSKVILKTTTLSIISGIYVGNQISFKMT